MQKILQNPVFEIFRLLVSSVIFTLILSKGERSAGVKLFHFLMKKLNLDCPDSSSDDDSLHHILWSILMGDVAIHVIDTVLLKILENPIFVIFRVLVSSVIFTLILGEHCERSVRAVSDDDSQSSDDDCENSDDDSQSNDNSDYSDDDSAYHQRMVSQYRCLFEVLGLTESATSSDIKTAYRRLSRIHHPDMGGDEENFKVINEAHEILNDKDMRAEYEYHIRISDDYGNDEFDAQDDDDHYYDDNV
eukprot:scaffold72028_cov35-Attheya_sp.AAC.1